MSDLGTLPGTLEAVWTLLADAPSNRASAARFLALATVGTSGGAETRMIVLRGADRSRGELTAFTNRASAKTSELARSPNATLLVWDAPSRLQIRLRVEIAQRPGSAEEWAGLPTTDQWLYARNPMPGDPMVAPDAATPLPDPALLTILTARIDEIETLHLGRELHRRALFRRNLGFKGEWIAP